MRLQRQPRSYCLNASRTVTFIPRAPERAVAGCRHNVSLQRLVGLPAQAAGPDGDHTSMLNEPVSCPQDALNVDPSPTSYNRSSSSTENHREQQCSAQLANRQKKRTQYYGHGRFARGAPHLYHFQVGEHDVFCITPDDDGNPGVVDFGQSHDGASQHAAELLLLSQRMRNWLADERDKLNDSWVFLLKQVADRRHSWELDLWNHNLSSQWFPDSSFIGAGSLSEILDWERISNAALRKRSSIAAGALAAAIALVIASMLLIVGENASVDPTQWAAAASPAVLFSSHNGGSASGNVPVRSSNGGDDPYY